MSYFLQRYSATKLTFNGKILSWALQAGQRVGTQIWGRDLGCNSIFIRPPLQKCNTYKHIYTHALSSCPLTHFLTHDRRLELSAIIISRISFNLRLQCLLLGEHNPSAGMLHERGFILELGPYCSRMFFCGKCAPSITLYREGPTSASTNYIPHFLADTEHDGDNICILGG